LFVETVSYKGHYLSTSCLSTIHFDSAKGEIHLRMHAGKLSDGILKFLVVSISDVVGELFLHLLEGFNLLN